MHRRVNSNIIDQGAKPRDSHRRTLSNSDFKISQLSSGLTTSITYFQKNSLILPDSLNSSAIHPHIQTDDTKFLDCLDASLKHFTTLPTSSPSLKQISELKSQISIIANNIESLKTNKLKLTQKLTALLERNLESEQENEKLEEYVGSLKNHLEKVKGLIQRAENELRGLKKKNSEIEGKPKRRDSRSNTYMKEGVGNSSNDEFDVFNAEENSCNVFADPFQFGNPSPKVQGKSLYSRGLKK